MTQTSENANQKKLSFFVIAGEESGDIHGSGLITAMNKIYPTCQFVGHGGNKMAAQGVHILEHIDNLSMVGFSEVIKHLPYMKRVMTQTIKKITEISPTRIILIDYPGFNLRLIKKISSCGIPITYFILPQVWAWKENRVRIIHDFVDQSLSIFPFEPGWFKERGVRAHYVGHPFSESSPPKISRRDYFKNHNLDPKNPLLVLMPGSRQQEVDRHWNILLETTKILSSSIPNLQVIVGKAPPVTLPSKPENFCIEHDSNAALHFGSAAIIASGTATLEAAVADIPFIVCYRMSSFSWYLIKWLSKLSYASMVNLISNKEVVPEFLHNRMTPNNLSKAILPLIIDPSERKSMCNDFEQVRKLLGEPGVYDRLAKEILRKHVSC